jgi:hypothetical protein
VKQLISLVFVFTFSLSAWSRPAPKNIFEEVLYNEYQSSILSLGDANFLSIQGFTPEEQSLYVDALWDLTEEGSQEANLVLEQLDDYHYQLVDRLRIAILKIRNKNAQALPKDLIIALKNALMIPSPETRLLYTLAAYEKELQIAGHNDIIKLAKAHKQYFDIAEEENRKDQIPDEIIYDLFHKTPDITTYMNGEYVRSVKIFMFCRENRLYPCLMTMRNALGEIVRNDDGSLWVHPALASSARGLPSYSRNGNTPAGILTIDSVMPSADQQISFGKFRRMILNFIPKSKNENLLKSLLPETSKDQIWWKTSVTARDIGRNLFRIHGTGKLNHDPSTPYYPFMRTSGCIAQRENIYDDIEYMDQQTLLDSIMMAMDLIPNYENELKVKGILYLIEIDDQNSAVTDQDLAIRGIE